ncbi:SubName: Full=Uncharacterized protein {ECO:0000313/EMBL:CCA69700.1} [Serendipita indica DSM 11827]|uniref:Uncharacterized protein n=1 Tax=Serendipita indica (strain DSM 11827) TaxID=1109443 RepID=G4TEF7_SERID|nr:SubName: Full=Uncharacterized protein {ECO:0000313/EMBL:CCA69700.1} [Serendipita indica DSM 11827]CCA69700.1 hypothetical protein PIIN_03641 [Serendipita indica DSM 11827]
MDPRFTSPTEPPRRKSKVSLSQLLAHIRSTDQREGIQGFIFNSPAPSVASSRSSSFTRRRSSCVIPDSRHPSDRSIILVPSYDSESDSDCECQSAITASSIGSFTRKGSGTPSHLRCIVEVDGEKPTLTTDCPLAQNTAPSLPSHVRQRRPPPLGLRCVVDVSRDPSLDTWTFSTADSGLAVKTPSSVDSFKCKGIPFDEHVGSTVFVPVEKAPKKPPMSAPATDWAAFFRTDISTGPPPVNKATRPRKSSVGETVKKPRPLPPLPTRLINHTPARAQTYPPAKSQNRRPLDAPPDYSLVDPSLEVQCVKASRRRGGLFSPLAGGSYPPQLVKQSSAPLQHSRLDAKILPTDDIDPPRTMRQKIKNGIASMHGKSNSQDSASRKPLRDASSRNNSLEGGQPCKLSLSKTLRKKSIGSRKKSLPSAWFDDDECTDGSSDKESGITLVVPARIQHEHTPQTQGSSPFDPNFSFARRCQPRLSVSEAPAPRWRRL